MNALESISILIVNNSCERRNNNEIVLNIANEGESTSTMFVNIYFDYIVIIIEPNRSKQYKNSIFFLPTIALHNIQWLSILCEFPQFVNTFYLLCAHAKNDLNHYFRSYFRILLPLVLFSGNGLSAPSHFLSILWPLHMFVHPPPDPSSSSFFCCHLTPIAPLLEIM